MWLAHSVGWSHRLNIKQKASWEPELISFWFMTVDVMWQTTWNSCHYDFTAMMVCTPKLLRQIKPFLSWIVLVMYLTREIERITNTVMLKNVKKKQL